MSVNLVVLISFASSEQKTISELILKAGLEVLIRGMSLCLKGLLTGHIKGMVMKVRLLMRALSSFITVITNPTVMLLLHIGHLLHHRHPPLIVL